MNSSPSRKTYGTLSLSPAFVQAAQLEWQMVERPSPPARFLNFPLADSPTAPEVLPDTRKRKTRLAA